jgi:hypothetical protein
LRSQRGLHLSGERAPVADIAHVEHVLRAIRIVEIEQRGLRENISGALRRLMTIVAFNL